MPRVITLTLADDGIVDGTFDEGLEASDIAWMLTVAQARLSQIVAQGFCDPPKEGADVTEVPLPS